jgi:hypothetical protein
MNAMSSDSGESERSTLPDGPDTEPSDLLSESMSSESEDISVRMESSAHPAAQTTASHPARSLAKTARSAENDGVLAPQAAQNSNTTQQSMQKPDVKLSEVPHSRRFLSIENDLSQLDASFRLMEKSVISAQKEARIAWILATAALLAAALGIAL